MSTPAPKLFESIFTQYDGWEDNGSDSLQVYDAVLAQDFPPFVKGTVINTLFIEMDKAELELWSGDESYIYDLTATFTAQPSPGEDEDEDEEVREWPQATIGEDDYELSESED